MNTPGLFCGVALTLGAAAVGVACAHGSTSARAAGDGSASPTPTPASGVEAARPAPAIAPTPPLELRWSPDGTRLLVGEGWLFDPVHGAYTRLPCPFTGAAAAAACNASVASFSPDRRRVLRIDGEDLAIDTLPAASAPRGLPVVRTRIPTWVKARTIPAAPPATESEKRGETTAAAEAGEVVNVGFWLSPRQVLVQQFFRHGDGGLDCRVLTIPVRAPGPAPTPPTLPTSTSKPSRAPADGAILATAWTRPPGGCIDADYHHLTRVDSGPGAWLALHSEGEGRYALGLVRYTVKRGQSSEPAVPSVDIEGASIVTVRFASNGKAVDLVTPCDLQVTENARTVSCDDPFARATWNLFRRDLPAGPLRLRRADLPPGAVLHPTGDRFAWPQGASICTGDPAAGAQPPACFPLPK